MKTDLVKHEIEIPEVPEFWDYEQSVKKVKAFIYKWKNIKKEIAIELKIARTILKKNFEEWQKQGGKILPPPPSWTQYCIDIGSERHTVNGWLRRIFGPAMDEEKLDAIEEDLDNRAIIPYDDNIYFLSNKFQEKREGDFKLIGEGETFPTLKRRSWFFHKETGAEFTLREYARVQTFPESFKFVGTYETIKDQIGNAVAPFMAKHVGRELEGKTFGDLFAGCGGLSCGFEMLGKRAIWAIERNAKYARTYKANHPHAFIITRDIKKLDPKDFKKVDILVGGPPCQGFSLSGLRFKNDPRNKLYKEFLRFAEALEPKEFLMENVMQIKGLKDQIIRDFEGLGYKVEAKTVKGLEIGMRQRRNRFFFTGRKA